MATLGMSLGKPPLRQSPLLLKGLVSAMNAVMHGKMLLVSCFSFFSWLAMAAPYSVSHSLFLSSSTTAML